MSTENHMPVHELKGFAAWKANIHNILVKIDSPETSEHKQGELVKNLQALGEKVSNHVKILRKKAKLIP